MTVVWALLLASWVAIGVLALALAGFLGQLRTVQADLRTMAALRPRGGAGSLPPFPDQLVVMVDPACRTCAELVDQPGIENVAVLARGDSPAWPAHTVVDQHLFDEVDPSFVPALVRTGPDGAILDIAPITDGRALGRSISANAGTATTKG